MPNPTIGQPIDDASPLLHEAVARGIRNAVPQHAAPGAAGQTTAHANQLTLDLDHSAQHGKLRDSQLAVLVLDRVRQSPPLELSGNYDFESLEFAIREAEELLRTANHLAGKLEGEEAAIQAVRTVVVSLGRAIVPSRRLFNLVIDVTETILGLEEIAMAIRWPAGNRDEFYNAVVWGTGADVDRLLEELCGG